MKNRMLEVKDLWVRVKEKMVLKGINLRICKGEVHILFGPNGSGKSTLLASVMGLSGYEIVQGEIWFKNERIDGLSVDAIARKGIGLAFQHPPAIRGVRLKSFIQSISPDQDAKRLLGILDMEYLGERELNLGFSGGELKRSEILKLMAQNPELFMLDEPESGVDLENIAVIARAIKTMLQKDQVIKKRTTSGIIITHTGYILEYVEADIGHVFLDGKIVCSGNPREIFAEIRRSGYEECVRCVQTNTESKEEPWKKEC